VLAPHGGREDFSVLFHEAGHAEHFSSVDPGLAFEFRCLGDNAITEGFAFLLQHLSEEPAWLSRHLAVPESDELVAHARSERLVYLRRYTAKLAYELELHGLGGEPGAASAARYAELMNARVGASWAAQGYLADVDYHSVDPHIQRLRKKLESVGDPGVSLEAVPGLGYRLSARV